jgi:probable HAF family extracellular repeat protein
MTDLNTLIAPGSGFTLTYALGISDNGYITGYGTNTSGYQDAFLLIPNTVPMRTTISRPTVNRGC